MNHLIDEKTLTERFAEHVAGPKDNLRAQLIEAVAQHEGWEESAIAMVDEAIMPVISAYTGNDKLQPTEEAPANGSGSQDLRHDVPAELIDALKWWKTMNVADWGHYVRPLPDYIRTFLDRLAFYANEYAKAGKQPPATGAASQGEK